MILSGDVFKEILKSFKTEQPMADKRRSARVGIRARVTMIPIVKGALAAPIQVWCRDIAMTGIAVLVANPLKVGQQFVLQLTREDEGPMRLLCEVMRKEKVHDDLYMIGAKYLSPDAPKLPVAPAAPAASTPASPVMAPATFEPSSVSDAASNPDAEILRIKRSMLGL
jgi:hypothetical protein